MITRAKHAQELDHSAAILTPVPHELLVAGRRLCKERGHVAFMTKSAQPLAKAERLRDGRELAVLIFASKDPGSTPGDYRVTWLGRFRGFTPCGTPAAVSARLNRPESDAADIPGACLWFLSNLVQLDPGLTKPLSSILTFGNGKARSGLPPHGLCVVPYPSWLLQLEPLLR